MIHFANCASLLRRQAAVLTVLSAGLAFVSAARALDLDFNVASGDFTTVSNWTDTTNAIPVPAAAAPTIGDTAYVRNGGTVTINSDVSATQFRIGARRQIVNPDYDNNGVVDAADYVLWRKGSLPLANDATPADDGPEDYTFWKSRYGALTADNDIGGSGTLNWTGGEITGPAGFHAGGPVLLVGRHVNLSVSQLTEYDFPGYVIQNVSATTKILLHGGADDKFQIGETGTTPTPHSSYTLQNGTIGLAIGGSNIQGANGNDGIAVKNGYFTMTGGQIIDATPDDLRAGTLTVQRFMTIGNQSGNPSGAAGTENYALATFTGGVVDVLGGMRLAPSPNSRAYLNINGPITITTGGDTSIGYNATNGVGEMTIGAGTYNVGRNYTDPVSGSTNNLTGRLQVGHRGRGSLIMSGGTINVTKDVRVGTEQAAGGSFISMTGGTINTLSLNMGVSGSNPYQSGYLGASIILNGPTASFLQSGSGGAIIADQGKALFEVQQGTALLGGGGTTIQVGNTVTSEATINVKGGKLTLGGTVIKNTASAVPPVFGLTGGILEWNPPTNAALAFQADLTNVGTQLSSKVNNANALLQITVGNRAGVPDNFAMSGGSWNIDINPTIATTLGADWFNASAGTASLTGGTLSINNLTPLTTPSDGQLFRILRGGLGTTLGAPGSVNITGAFAGHWTLVEAPILVGGSPDPLWPLDEEIQLKYTTALVTGSGAGFSTTAVPEPASAVLVVFAAAGLLTARRPRSRARA